MSDFLAKIVAAKRRQVAAAQAALPMAQLQAQALARPPAGRSLIAALARPGVQIIAEIKRASPSCGDINRHLDPAALARAYGAGGAAAISVLTEADFFKGSVADLTAARAATALPVLRKDFIIDPYQIYETRLMGADAILLIVRLLDDARLRDFHQMATELGLDALVEVHDVVDCARVRRLAPPLVAINNRDLSSFATSLDHAGRLAGLFPPSTHLVAASGIQCRADIEAAGAAGLKAFLVGEALAGAADPRARLEELRGVPR